MLLLVLVSCGPGYEQEDGNWAWVAYSGTGKFVRSFDPDDATFEILDNEKYAKDKDSVYLEGIAIEHADPTTFEVLSENGYSKDKKHVFLGTYIIIFADPETFDIIDWPYARDDKRIFNGNLPMFVDDIKSFQITKEGDDRCASVKFFFIEVNKDYQWLDTIDVDGIIVGEWAEAKTDTEKFKGFRKVE